MQVRLKKITKSFGSQNVLDNIDLDVKDGELVALVGPSGCGKSTLLRTVAGLERASSGEIWIGDREVSRTHPKDRDIAMVFQNYALYPHLSIYENIAFPLRVTGQPASTVKEKVEKAADLFSIRHLLARKPRHVSGGERQRTALARAMVRSPSVFLLDEPLSNLDAKLRHTAREEIRLFQQRTGQTALYVTHDQVEAMGLGDRIVLLKSGVIQQFGTPSEIYRNPANTFVATFIGAPPMNLIERSEFTLGVRPENLLPLSFYGNADLFRIQMHVDRIEFLGGQQLIYGTTMAPLPETKIIANIPVSVECKVSVDNQITLAARQSDLRMFDTADGKALPLGTKISSAWVA